MWTDCVNCYFYFIAKVNTWITDKLEVFHSNIQLIDTQDRYLVREHTGDKNMGATFLSLINKNDNKVITRFSMVVSWPMIIWSLLTKIFVVDTIVDSMRVMICHVSFVPAFPVAI